MSNLNILSGGAAQGLVGSLAPAFKVQTGLDIAGAGVAVVIRVTFWDALAMGQFLAGSGRHRRFRVSNFAQTPPSARP